MTNIASKSNFHFEPIFNYCLGGIFWKIINTISYQCTIFRVHNSSDLFIAVFYNLEPELYFYCIMVWETIVHIPANGSEPGVRFSDGTFPVSTNHRSGFQDTIWKQDSNLCTPPYPWPLIGRQICFNQSEARIRGTIWKKDSQLRPIGRDMSYCCPD